MIRVKHEGSLVIKVWQNTECNDSIKSGGQN